MMKVPLILRLVTDTKSPKPLNVTRFSTIFDVKFAEAGSSRESVQRKVYNGFVTYLRDVNGKCMHNVTCYINILGQVGWENFMFFTLVTTNFRL